MSQDTWREVKSKVEGLGLKLKLHLEQESNPSDTTAEPGTTKANVEDFNNKMQEAFASLGDAVKDPAVRADFKEIGVLLKDAMAETFSNVSTEVGDTLKKAGDKAAGGGDADTTTDSTITDADAPKPADEG